MFGYRLKFVKKKDLEELDIFEKTVRFINSQVHDMINYIIRIDTIDPPIQNQLLLDMTGLNAFVDVYYHNKFSSPSNTFQMFRMLDDMKKRLNDISDITVECARIAETIKLAHEAEANQDPTFDRDEFETMYKQTIDTANQQIQRLLRRIIADLKNIDIVIEADLFRLIIGVDIIKDYKDRQKRFIDDKQLMTNFGVRYKVITNDDRRFLEKEKYKNEQSSRTRTSDGGTEETV